MSQKIKFGGRSEDDKDQYDSYLPTPLEDEEEDNNSASSSSSSRMSKPINPSKELLNSTLEDIDDAELVNRYKEQNGSGLVNTRIADRESEVISIFIFLG